MHDSTKRGKKRKLKTNRKEKTKEWGKNQKERKTKELKLYSSKRYHKHKAVSAK